LIAPLGGRGGEQHRRISGAPFIDNIQVTIDLACQPKTQDIDIAKDSVLRDGPGRITGFLFQPDRQNR